MCAGILARLAQQDRLLMSLDTYGQPIKLGVGMFGPVLPRRNSPAAFALHSIQM